MEVTGISVAKATAIENASVISGTVNGSAHLILTTKGGTDIDAGSVSARTVTETLQNKTIDLAANTVTMTKAQLQTAVTDDDVVTLAGAQTVTGAKTFSAAAFTAGQGHTEFKRRTTDNSKASNNTLAADSQLVFAAEANATYEVDIELLFTGGAGGVQVSIQPPNPFYINTFFTRVDGTTGANSVVMSTQLDMITNPTPAFMSVATITTHVVRARAMVETGANAGNISVNWAQASSNATATVLKVGSSITAKRIA